MNPGKEGQAWILLWDMVSIHASEATLAAMKAMFPYVVLDPAAQHVVLAALRYGSLFAASRAAFRRKRPRRWPALCSTARSTTWSRTEHGDDSLLPNGQLSQSRTSATKTRRGRLVGVVGAHTAPNSAGPLEWAHELHATGALFAKHITSEPAPDQPRLNLG